MSDSRIDAQRSKSRNRLILTIFVIAGIIITIVPMIVYDRMDVDLPIRLLVFAIQIIAYLSMFILACKKYLNPDE
ncbi:MAG: hypothetical protein IKN41_08650 [Candidatus Methanomethylophilaceae archaeon]|nr:hypothetical protein [Candidatus Methanomethylophilaceae archaeon]